MSDEDAGELDRLRALKVKIPVRQHIQLRTLKVLTGKNLSQTVREALGRYFEDLEGFDPDAAAPLDTGGDEG